MGVPDLTASDATRVDEANDMANYIVELLSLMEEKGRWGILENPFNSYLWELPKVRSLWAAGFADTQYYACSWGGWRAKDQRLLSNIDEIKLIRARCRHMHQKGEWQPRKTKGRWVYPSSEEAEYTATLCFAIAAATSWWAVRVGRAKLRVLHMPVKDETTPRTFSGSVRPDVHNFTELGAEMGLVPPVLQDWECKLWQQFLPEADTVESVRPAVSADNSTISAIPQQLAFYWSQAKMTEGILQQFPAGWLTAKDIPYLEDVLTEPCFCAYHTWWHTRGQKLTDSVPPRLGLLGQQSKHGSTAR